MIGPGALEECYANLEVYDVQQKGWEQEPNGFEANAHHTLTHLVTDGFQKDFSDPEQVERGIAPDNLMYGLRLARWANVGPRGLFKGSIIEAGKLIDLPENHLLNDERTNLALTAQRVATCALADLIHDGDHSKTHDEALQTRRQRIERVSTLLVASAGILGDRFNFYVPDAFDKRLADLRKRFNIPNPPSVSA